MNLLRRRPAATTTRVEADTQLDAMAGRGIDPSHLLEAVPLDEPSKTVTTSSKTQTISWAEVGRQLREPDDVGQHDGDVLEPVGDEHHTLAQATGDRPWRDVEPHRWLSCEPSRSHRGDVGGVDIDEPVAREVHGPQGHTAGSPFLFTSTAPTCVYACL